MNRRSFLRGALLLPFASWLTACRNPNQVAFRVRLLKNSIPGQLLDQFRKQPPATPAIGLDVTAEDQLQTLFTALQTWKALPSATSDRSNLPNLITLGDYWLSTAIQQQTIQPLNPSQWQQWSKLSEPWRAIVTRDDQGNVKPSGKVWGAPYRWGATVIAYRSDIFQQRNLQPPTDWSDLWRPELKDRIGLLDHPRETIGLTLKKLGQSYNPLPSLKQIPSLEPELQALHQQTQFYSADAYLQPLILGDAWLVVGWSTDILPAARRNPNLKAVFPKSGTALSADLWVCPTHAQATPDDLQRLIDRWIDFYWQPSVASQLSLLTHAASPLLTRSDNPASETFATNPLLLASAEQLQRSEFLQPLNGSRVEEYRSLWETLRQVG